MSGKLTVVTISQHLHILNHFVQLELIQCYILILSHQTEGNINESFKKSKNRETVTIWLT